LQLTINRKDITCPSHFVRQNRVKHYIYATYVYVHIYIQWNAKIDHQIF